MLPERLSTDLTSLSADEDRSAMVVDMTVDGSVRSSPRACTARSCATRPSSRTASVGAWLEGRGALPAGVAAVPGLADNLRLQDAAAQRLKAWRHEHGALELETLEARAVSTATR